jgi:hypothetical protein
MKKKLARARCLVWRRRKRARNIHLKKKIGAVSFIENKTSQKYIYIYIGKSAVSFVEEEKKSQKQRKEEKEDRKRKVLVKQVLWY